MRANSDNYEVKKQKEDIMINEGIYEMCVVTYGPFTSVSLCFY